MNNTSALFSMLRSQIEQGDKVAALQLVDLLESASQPADPGDASKPGETFDPRAPNCRFHSPDNEPVTGVWLTYHPVQGAKYKLESVRLVDEQEAGGRHFITVLQPDGCQVALATGYCKSPDRFDAIIPHQPGDDLILDGHGKPPDLGPYAVFLMDGQGNKISDVIGSFMLPRGHHVCYVCKFKRS